MKLIWDAFADAAVDTLKLIPFLFVTYLLMEIFEHKMSEKARAEIEKAGHFGPFIGGVIGVCPQCGFSAAAASLYSGRLITAGTLIAIFLSTSDEMLPVMISEKASIELILKIVCWKAVLGIIAGCLVDLCVKIYDKKKKIYHNYEKETRENHHCEEKDGIWISAFKHTTETTIYILIFSFIIGIAVSALGEKNLSEMVINYPVAGQIITGAIGLIPNCAASVVITEMYLNGVIGFGQMMSGLLVGAGVGILVLVRGNHNAKQNLAIIGTLYCFGVLFGCLLELFY